MRRTEEYIITHDTVLLKQDPDGLVPAFIGIGKHTIVRGYIEAKNRKGFPVAPVLHITNAPNPKMIDLFVPSKAFELFIPSRTSGFDGDSNQAKKTNTGNMQ